MAEMALWSRGHTALTQPRTKVDQVFGPERVCRFPEREPDAERGTSRTEAVGRDRERLTKNFEPLEMKLEFSAEPPNVKVPGPRLEYS